MSATTHPHRLARQRRIQRHLAACEKGVAIHMQNTTGLTRIHRDRTQLTPKSARCQCDPAGGTKGVRGGNICRFNSGLQISILIAPPPCNCRPSELQKINSVSPQLPPIISPPQFPVGDPKALSDPLNNRA